MDSKTLIEICGSIGREVRRALKNPEELKAVEMNEYGDRTMGIDLVAERALEKELSRRRICARIVSEELGERIYPDGDPTCTLLFDPIDGSTNLLIGVPFYCTSIAYSPLVEKVGINDMQIGVVHDICGRRTYHAERGKGAFVDGRRIPVRVEKDKRIICIYMYGTNFEIPGELRRSIIRTFGSIALEICMVAEGKIDAVIDSRGTLRSFDVGASALILREAGGRITDEKGRELDHDVRARNISVVASLDHKLHQTLLRYVR